MCLLQVDRKKAGTKLKKLAAIFFLLLWIASAIVLTFHGLRVRIGHVDTHLPFRIAHLGFLFEARTLLPDLSLFLKDCDSNRLLAFRLLGTDTLQLLGVRDLNRSLSLRGGHTDGSLLLHPERCNMSFTGRVDLHDAC